VTITPGEFYYGAPCPKCGRFMPIILDDEHGGGKPARITGRIIEWVCPYCRTTSLHVPETLVRRPH
jgi:hypothetical protein